MSVQIIVATPSFYLTGWFTSENVEQRIHEFYEVFNGDPDLSIGWDDRREEFFCTDIPVRLEYDLARLLTTFDAPLQKNFTADIYLPKNFSTKKRITLSYYIQQKPTDYSVLSTQSFRESIQLIDSKLDQWVGKAKADEFRSLLNIYRQAIEVSDREKAPIFWSY